MNDFIPNDYRAPVQGGNYTKIEEGETKLRILSKPVFGWVAWVDNKPHRFPFAKKPADKFADPLRHFWAMIVWNYKAESIQVWEVTQATIQGALIDLSRNEEWQSPTGYDIKIVKTGKEKNTKYTVIPSPKKNVSPVVEKAAMEKPVYLDALFNDADPFVVTDKSTELEIHSLPF